MNMDVQEINPYHMVYQLSFSHTAIEEAFVTSDAIYYLLFGVVLLLIIIGLFIFISRKFSYLKFLKKKEVERRRNKDLEIEVLNKALVTKKV
jgi:cytochrome bd-type quinol oxidase subunit 2